jgi:hydroxyacylglutathione hydrolase
MNPTPRVVIVPVLMDNYAYLVIDEGTEEAGVVDPAEAEPILAAAARENVKLTAILNTHHHFDHTGGNRDLLERDPGLRVIGSRADGAKIPGITEPVESGDRVRIGGLEGEVLFVPCHTRGHIAYLFGRALFSGDTLFAAGCGRFFEGSAAEMYHALTNVLGALPDETLVYCGHEYTETNLEFAKTLEPTNRAVRDKLERVKALGPRPSVPTTLGEERTYNPFLRTRSPELIAHVAARVPDVDGADPVRVLAAVRALKDEFG